MRLVRLDKDAEESLETLLSPWERGLVEDVCLELGHLGLEDAGAGLLPSEQRRVVESSLGILVRELESRKGERREFPSARYREWRKVRGRSIEALEAIGNSIGKDRKRCNISRLVGNCASFVGGGIFTASAVLVPFTLGLSTPLAVGGGLAMGLGSATSIGASVAELTLLKKRLQDAAEILQQDKEALELLDSHLASDMEASGAFQSILEIDPLLNLDQLVQILKEFLDSARKVLGQADRYPLIQALLLSLMSQCGICLVAVPSLVGLLLIVVLLLDKFELGNVKKWKTSAKRFSSLANASVGLVGPLAAIASRSEVAVAKCATKAVARGAVGMVGMTVDAASIVLTSIDLHKGSVSVESSKVLDIARVLREEASLLDEAYG